jgi:hypothetical protein
MEKHRIPPRHSREGDAVDHLREFDQISRRLHRVQGPRGHTDEVFQSGDADESIGNGVIDQLGESHQAQTISRYERYRPAHIRNMRIR